MIVKAVKEHSAIGWDIRGSEQTKSSVRDISISHRCGLFKKFLLKSLSVLPYAERQGG